jgi:hypothetical protein
MVVYYEKHKGSHARMNVILYAQERSNRKSDMWLARTNRWIAWSWRKSPCGLRLVFSNLGFKWTTGCDSSSSKRRYVCGIELDRCCVCLHCVSVYALNIRDGNMVAMLYQVWYGNFRARFGTRCRCPWWRGRGWVSELCDKLVRHEWVVRRVMGVRVVRHGEVLWKVWVKADLNVQITSGDNMMNGVFK